MSRRETGHDTFWHVSQYHISQIAYLRSLPPAVPLLSNCGFKHTTRFCHSAVFFRFGYSKFCVFLSVAECGDLALTPAQIRPFQRWGRLQAFTLSCFPSRKLLRFGRFWLICLLIFTNKVNFAIERNREYRRCSNSGVSSTNMVMSILSS
jgi:hypothetical protein